MQFRTSIRALAMTTLLVQSAASHAAEWSDTSLGVKVGDRYAEPGIAEPIHKTVYEFVHIDGDKLGKNLIVGQILKSNSADPAAGGTSVGAQEFFGFYRRAFSLSKLTGSSFAFGPIKDVSLLGRFDRGPKNIQFAAATNKEMAGVGLDWDVPKGYVESSLYAYHEKGYNGFIGREITYNSFRADTSWSLPFTAGIPLLWNGGLSYVGAKGTDGFGHATKPETRLYTELLTEVGSKTGFLVGVAFEAYRNKYGTDQRLTPGAKQNTFLLVAEYHF